ncbi:MAG: hypothetical protein MUC90_08515 [Thermoplasmata archaeon]|jgi:hypothetical protein|nr:hypothetical protein [Thermoplasmata archaeon]
MVSAYGCVALCYCAFFAMPVSPAEPQDAFSFSIEESVYSSFPHIRETVYTNGKAFVGVATIRTISAPNAVFSAAFDRLDGYAEDYARDQYGIEIDVVAESNEKDYSFSGHRAVRYIYGVWKEVTVGYPPFETKLDVKMAEMGAIAWFCNVDFESVVLFYVTPAYFVDEPELDVLAVQTMELVAAVACH